MVIVNPILRGFHPDASVCVVGEDYYIAVSTFEWWPGVMIYHSKDLVHWRLAGRPLNRKSQLCLRGDRNSGGIWAPHLSWAKGRFWLMITDMKTDQCFKDTLNYVMSCETVGGEWSDPVFVHGLGFDLPDYFQILREPLGKHMSLCERPGYLRLYGQQSIASLHSQSMVARRWQNVCFRAGTVMEFQPKSYNQMAGLTCFYNTENYMYAYVSYDEDRKCRILDILVCGHGKTSAELGEERISIPDHISAVCLEVQVNREKLQFYYRWEKEPWKPLGGELSADHLSDDYIRDSALVFTGAMVGICVQDLYDHSAFADFDSFYYREE